MQLSKWFTAVDAHSGGQPLRIITSGVPHLRGDTQLQRSQEFGQGCDSIRRLLMSEPRGHHGMAGCFVTQPASGDAELGLLFMDNGGMSPMSGHGIISAVTALIGSGQLAPGEADSAIRIDTPAGLIAAYANFEGSEVHSVSFHNVPSFVYAKDVPVALHGLEFTVDIAFGGAFYAIVEAGELGGVRLQESELPVLQSWGRDIKQYLEMGLNVRHPLIPELEGIHGVVIADSTTGHMDRRYRNVTVLAGGQFDRSPGGAGVCALMASLAGQGKLGAEDTSYHEGIVGTQITARITAETTVKDYPAIVPLVTGTAYIIGFLQFVVDPTDPLAEGFLLC
ncbi:proline racemase family protein [Paenibacillus sp. sptzw28]|uniref:proline racemase family protein n=1 Tax=Paenibacillus sp. sptzw28 TaxID=715179 RepID=UPI001C6E48FE|nr:proline racemase family protein [Paenibacillus sp. sptzw28]QYR19504.1 proline racemase family protein [Paenibacillus sp. sptzw28]